MAGAQNDRTGLVRRALRNRAVRGIVAGFAGITLGEWVLGTTVAVHAYDAGGALAVGLIGFRFAPAALAGLWTARLADHAQRHRVLGLTAAGRAVTTAVAAAALALHLPFVTVVALVWLDAAIGSGYRPAQAALLPSLVRTPGELTAATALISNVKSTGQLVGALIGGVLVAGLPIALPVAAAALLYLVGMTLTAGIRHTRPFVTAIGGLRGLPAGVQALRADRAARLIAGYACLRSLMRGLWLALAVVASLRLLSLGRSGFGLLMAAAAVGALAAIVATGRLVGNRRLTDWFAFGLILCGLPIAAIGVMPSAAPALALIVVWGLGMALADVGAQTLLNRIVPGSSIGPVTGVVENSKLLLEGLGSLIAPLLLVAFGIRGALLVAGGTLPALVLIGRRRLARVDDHGAARHDLLQLLQQVSFFTPLALDGLEGVAARLHVERADAGTEILRQGEVDERRWYLVDAGELVVEVDGFLVGELRRGSQFGERSLLRGVPRSATVRAVTDVRLYALDQADFVAAVAGVEVLGAQAGAADRADRLDPETALARVPLMSSLAPAARSRLVGRSRILTVEAGTPIVSSGERDDTYQVLLSGRARVLVDNELRQELLPGDAFGEIAVLHQVPRTATVVAREESTVLVIAGDDVRGALRERGDGHIAALFG